MAVRTSSYLKGKFEDGDRPVGDDFTDLIDSCLNADITSLSADGDIERIRLLSDGLSALGIVYSTGNINTDGSVNIKGNIVNDNITTDGTNISISGPTTIAGDATITGTLSASTTVYNNLDIGNRLTVTNGISGDFTPVTDISVANSSSLYRLTHGFFGGVVQGGIFSCDPTIPLDTTLTSGTRNFCIEEIDISAGVTLNISSDAELRVTPYDNF